MTISDQGRAAIQAYESANFAAANARESANCYAMKLMVQHLHEVHGFGVRKLSEHMGLKLSIIKKMLDKNERS